MSRLVDVLILILWLIVVFAMGYSVLAHEMNEPDAEWYRSLVVPGAPGEPNAGSSCCNGGHGMDSDCRNVETRERNGHWEAFIDDKTFPTSPYSPLYGHAPNDWVPVPDGAIIRGRANPTGAPVACWYNGVIRCFVEGTET